MYCTNCNSKQGFHRRYLDGIVLCFSCYEAELSKEDGDAETQEL